MALRLLVILLPALVVHFVAAAGTDEASSTSPVPGESAAEATALRKSTTLVARVSTTPSSPSACLDVPANWIDSSKDGCSAYADESWCTKSGGYGKGWNVSWGTFDAYATNGWNAAQACCKCGGGTTSEAVLGKNCLDDPSDWKDQLGQTCSTYATNSLCQGGGIGPRFSEIESFESLATGGISAKEACCSCGGGHITESETRCIDEANWMDILRRTCSTYHKAQLCTESKGVGVGWSEDLGTFEEYAKVGGRAATEACCSCGGGTRKVLKGVPNTQTKDIPRRHTYNGCECRRTWQRDAAGHCDDSCCNLDRDPLGESCIVKNFTCEGLEWGYCQPKTKLSVDKEQCIDYPFWKDAQGDDCRDYQVQQFCTSDGRLGLGWEYGWGNFSSYADSSGMDAAKACCACGGGQEANQAEQLESLENSRCSNYPPFWTDLDGETCDLYRSQNLCNAAGGYGAGWKPGMGTFERYASPDNLTAANVCCACGGGSRCEEDVDWVDSMGRSCKDYEEGLFCTRTGRLGPGWEHQSSIQAYAVDGLHALEACCACGGGTHSDLEEDDVDEWVVVQGDCTRDSEGCVMTPGFPENYPVNHICAIATPNVGRKAIHVEHFDLEAKFDILIVNDRGFSGSFENTPEGVLPKGRIWWTSDASKTASGWKLCPKVYRASGTWHSHDYNCGPGHGGEAIVLPHSRLAGDKAYVEGLSRADCRALCSETPGCIAVTYTLNKKPSECYGRKSIDLSRCIFGETHVTDIFQPQGKSIFGFSPEQVADIQVTLGPATILFASLVVIGVAGIVGYFLWKYHATKDDHPVFTGKITRYARNRSPSL